MPGASPGRHPGGEERVVRTRWRLILIAAAVLAVAAGVWLVATLRPPRPPDIAFAPYQDAYSSKMDFARLEHELPLTRAQLAGITPKSLRALDQEQVNQLYARLTAGPIPDGPFEGDLFFPRGASGHGRLSEIVGGLRGLGVQLGTLTSESVGRALWKGKVFYREQRILRNRIEDLAILRPVLGDTGDIPRLSVDGERTWLLFPAKLYCGQSLLDGRRESIIIDYAFSDDLPGYREIPDFLAGRRGLRIRDEIRMIHPGFYLGRAYANGVFLLNFTLENATLAERERDAFVRTGPVAEDCWAGTQRART
jgi:hypothetical protein